jgi:enoyl-CoA hydratase
MAQQVRTERDGRVVVATLENPPHALMTREMIAQLGALVREVDADPGIGAVVLTGAHESRFLAHYDVAQLLEAARAAPSLSARQAAVGIRTVAALRRIPGSESAVGRTPAAGVLELRRFHQMLLDMQRSGAVFIAAINGSAMGGGCELSLACDLRLMADGPFLIGQPEILLGFPPGGGGTQRLPRLIGGARALELVLEGRPIEPKEAERIGLVHRLAAPAELLDEARATAARMARRSKPAVAAAKRAVLEGCSLPLEEGLRLEQAQFMSTLATEQAKRVMEAYVAHLEATGEVPAYDRDARESLIEGTFVDIAQD